MHKVVHSRVNMSKLDLTPSSKRRVNSAMSAVYLSRAVALRQVNQLEKQVQELKEENQILRDQMTIDKSADPTVSGPVLSYQRLHHDKTWREHTRELTGFKSVKELDDLWEFLDGEGEASALKCRESLVPDEDRKYRPHSRPHARKHSAQDCFLFTLTVFRLGLGVVFTGALFGGVTALRPVYCCESTDRDVYCWYVDVP